MLMMKSGPEIDRASAVKLGPKSMPCPCCGQRVASPPLDMLIDHYGINGLQEAILRAVWAGKGYPVPTERILERMYADDPDGGPKEDRQYAALKESMSRLRSRLAGSGVGIESAGPSGGWRLMFAQEPIQIAQRELETIVQLVANGGAGMFPAYRRTDDSAALAEIRAGASPRSVAWKLAGSRASLSVCDRHYRRLMRKLKQGKAW